MKNKLSRILETVRQESKSTQMAMAITIFAFASAIIITLGQASGIFLRADIGGNDYPPQTEPFERPDAPGYEKAITAPVAALDKSTALKSTKSDESHINSLEPKNIPWYKKLFN